MKKTIEPSPGHQSEEARTPELDVNPDDVCRLIQLAKDLHTKEAVVPPDMERSGSPADKLTASTSSNFSGDPLLEEFRSIIADLDHRQRVEVVALLRLGRGDYESEEWDQARNDTLDAWTDHTADDLLSHPMVADHMAKGLEMMGHSCP